MFLQMSIVSSQLRVVGIQASETLFVSTAHLIAEYQRQATSY